MLIGIEEVIKADREDELHECSFNWHHGGCTDLDQNYILASQPPSKQFKILRTLVFGSQNVPYWFPWKVFLT